MTALHQAAQKAVEAPITDERIRQLFIEHGWSDPLPAKESLLYELCRAAAREGRESALQQQPEPVAPNEWAAEAATVMAQFIHLSAQPERDAWAQNASRAIRLLNAPALQEVPREPVAVPISLDDAQMLLAWMDETFGNDSGTDWNDADAAAVGDALDAAIENFKRMRSAIAASPSTTQQQEAGNGWRLVPAEATAAMQRAADDYSTATANKPKGMWWWGRVYEAMLAAAPSTPENEQ